MIDERDGFTLQDFITKRCSPELEAQTLEKIIADPKYGSARNQTKRRDYAVSVAEKEGVMLSFDRRQIAKKAEELFEEKIQPIRKKELSQKVREIRAEKPKISKIAVAELLDIPERELYKYWEENN